MTLPVITAPMLEAHNACPEQVATVRKHWPDGAKLTKASLLKAARLKLDLIWFAEEFLSPTAWAEYNKVRASALAEYDKVRAPAWAEYDKVRASALATIIQKHGIIT